MRARTGLLPNQKWGDGTVEPSPRNGIGVDAHGLTSVPGAFADDDATPVPREQTLIARGKAAMAELGALDHRNRGSAPAEQDGAGRFTRSMTVALAIAERGFAPEYPLLRRADAADRPRVVMAPTSTENDREPVLQSDLTMAPPEWTACLPPER